MSEFFFWVYQLIQKRIISGNLDRETFSMSVVLKGLLHYRKRIKKEIYFFSAKMYKFLFEVDVFTCKKNLLNHKFYFKEI